MKKNTITFKCPSNFRELMRWLKQAEPMFKAGRFVFAGILVVMVIGMKDTITAIEFDPTFTGLLVWVMMLWLVITSGFK